MSDDTTYIQLMQYTAGTSFMFLLWLCAYFFRNGSGNRLRQITGWVLLVWVIQSVKDMALIWYPTVRFEFLHHVFVLIDMTAVPTCAFLLFELTRPGSMTLLRAALHEIPFILFILIYAFHPKDILYESAIACAVAYGTAVMLYVLFEIPAYHKRLKQSYSYHERIDLRWLYIILLSSWCSLRYGACLPPTTPSSTTRCTTCSHVSSGRSSATSSTGRSKCSAH